MANSSFPGAGPLPLSDGLTMASHLPQLTSETELQKLLADERMRSQMHRTNYEQLKEEHRRLQEEYQRLEEDIKHTIEESKIVQDKYRTMYEQSRKELAEKSQQMEELRSKMVTAKQLEILKMQVVEDVEKTYKDRFMKQEEELDEQRTVCNKLKYELSFVKSEYEHQLLEHQQVLEELKLQHEAEVTNLRKEREATITKVKTENTLDAERVRVLQRENAQLHLKVKGLSSEIDELQAVKEKQGFDVDHISRVQAKQITELTATIKSLETERESLRKQVEQLQREVVLAGDAQNKLTTKIHEVEKECIVLKNRADEATHKGKVDLTNLRMDMMKQRGDLERERDKLANLVDDLQTKLEISNHSIETLNRKLAEKEREAVRRVQAAREEEFQKYTQIENEKLGLETKLQEIERRRIDEDAHRHAEREKVEDRVRAALGAKENAERELLVMKTKVNHHESILQQLDRERSENSDLKSKLSKLEAELSSFQGNEHDMTDENIRLRNQVELLREEVKLTKDQYKKVQDSHELILSQQKNAFVEDKSQLELRLHDLEEKYKIVQGKYQKACSIHKKYKRKCQYILSNTKDKLELLEAKYEELQLEKKALETNIPKDTYSRLKKQWKDLTRRHGEFRRLLLSSQQQQIPIGDLTFGNISVPLEATYLTNISFTDQERQHQEDIRLLKQRLEIINSNQHQQMEELQEIAHSTFKGSLPDFGESGGFEDNIHVKSDVIDDESKEKADLEKSA